MIIIRLILAGILIYFSYRETGLITAMLFVLILLGAELSTWSSAKALEDVRKLKTIVIHFHGEEMQKDLLEKEKRNGTS